MAITVIEKKLLIKLKEKAINSECRIFESDFENFGAGQPKSYYVGDSHINNLFLNEKEFEKYKPFFEEGNGKEIKKIYKGIKRDYCKMQSLRSSSAMIVNILGRSGNTELLRINKNDFGIPEGEYDVSFERQLRTLNISNSRKYPAHVDGFLLSKDLSTVILIESKMFEYLDGEKNILSQSYLNSNNYYSKGVEFIDCFETCSELFEKLDYQQLIKHILGFYNAVVHTKECFEIYPLNREDLSKIKNVYLLNVVWRMTNTTSDLYHTYKPYWEKEVPSEEEISKMQSLFSSITKDIFKFVKVQFMPFDEFISIIDDSRMHYLNRYFI